MKATRLRAVAALGVLLLGAGYVVRGQSAKQEVRLEIEILKNGSVVGKPTVRLADGGSTSMQLNDGIEVKIKSTVISH